MVTSKERGGGLLIAVRNHLQAHIIEEWTVCETAYECLWVKINMPHYFGTLLICAVYLPPTVSKHNMELFCTYIESLSEQLQQNSFMLIGDFNCGYFFRDMEYPTDSIIRTLANMTKYFKLTSHNNTVFNIKQRILDLVLVKFMRNLKENSSLKKGISCKVEKGQNILKEDKQHPALSIVITWEKLQKLNKQKLNTYHLNYSFPNSTEEIEENLNPLVDNLFLNNRFNYNTADYESLYEEINTIDWTNILSLGNVNTALEQLYRTLYEAINKHVKTYKNRKIEKPQKKKFPFWWKQETHKLYKEKEWARKRKDNSEEYKIKYEELRQTSKDKILSDYKNHFSEID
uniref:Endonuclease/exonuclease/phosphatase domain-containing protein n=1 Tax=Cacopsylla melanoneura TaxID=428564 RepID=A0A8D9E8C8_9HEMI